MESKVKCKDPKLIEVAKRCEKILSKLKKHNFAEAFTNSNQPDVPCLNEVEKKLKTYQFTTVHTFAYEIRRIWGYYFSNGVKETDLYQKAMEISHYFEEIFSEAESNQTDDSKFENLSKKVQKIESQINQGGIKPITSCPPYIQKTASKQLPYNEKPMTITEKNLLGNNIRQLNADQMKGIINILSDQCMLDENSKYFEFDIDKLTTKKLRELERYVKKSLKTTTQKVITKKPTTKVNIFTKFSFIYYIIK